MTTDGPLKELPLAHRHRENGARFVPFAGYNMPIQFAGIVEEHNAVRQSAGLFDVSHMGEIRIKGPRAVEVANTLLTHDLRETDVGQARYCVMCHPDGGIVDDLIAYKLGPEEIFICVNAANRDKDYQFMLDHAPEGATITDESDDWVQLALQGQDAEEILAPICTVDLASLEFYHFEMGDVGGVRCMIARTGYTGEDGFELYIPTDQAEEVYDHVISSGRPVGMALCGLGSRDTLRLEAKFALYGQDITDETNPLEAGLSWVIKLDKPEDFIGRAAIERIKAEGVTRRLRGFKLDERAVPRPGYGVYIGDEKVGELTSGTWSPCLEAGVGLGYIDVAHTKAPSVDIEIRNKRVPATVTTKPFWQRDY